MAKIILEGLKVDDFRQLLNEVIESNLNHQSVHSKTVHGNLVLGKVQGSETYLTRNEVAELLNISLPTLHNYTKQGLINSYRIGNKVRYKESDVKAALQKRNYGKRVS